MHLIYNWIKDHQSMVNAHAQWYGNEAHGIARINNNRTNINKPECEMYVEKSGVSTDPAFPIRLQEM